MMKPPHCGKLYNRVTQPKSTTQRDAGSQDYPTNPMFASLEEEQFLPLFGASEEIQALDCENALMQQDLFLPTAPLPTAPLPTVPPGNVTP
eukprot:1189036-Rhodomonas_salina.1